MNATIASIILGATLAAAGQPVTQYLVNLAGPSAAVAPVAAQTYLDVSQQADNGFTTNTDLSLFGFPPFVTLYRAMVQPGTNRIWVVTGSGTNLVATFTGTGFEMTSTNGALGWLSSTNSPTGPWETNMADSPYIDTLPPGRGFWRLAPDVVLTWFQDSLPDYYDSPTTTATNQAKPPIPQ